MTKQVREYVGTPVGGREVLYLDTPGIGDIDVPLQKLFALLEQRLAGAEVDTHADTRTLARSRTHARTRMHARTHVPRTHPL